MQWAPQMIATDNYTANTLNQYSDVNGGTPVYDNNGNMTTDLKGRTHIYSAANTLARSILPGVSGSFTNIYSADGVRRMRSRPAAYGGVSRYYYDGDQEIMETDNPPAGQQIPSANTTRRYIRLPGSVDEVFLMIDYTLNGSCSDATPTSYAACERWAHADRLGSTVAVTNSPGALVEDYRYSPYGVSGTEGLNGARGSI